VGSSHKSTADLQETQETIGAVARGIRIRDFTANPQYLQCGYFAFREICPSTLYREEAP
jgi:hypothetical protein